MSKGTRVYSLRIPPQLMAEVYAFVARNLDRDRKGELTISKFIVDAIKERLGKLERARRSGAKQRNGCNTPTEARPPADASPPAISIADTDSAE